VTNIYDSCSNDSSFDVGSLLRIRSHRSIIMLEFAILLPVMFSECMPVSLARASAPASVSGSSQCFSVCSPLSLEMTSAPASVSWFPSMRSFVQARELGDGLRAGVRELA